MYNRQLLINGALVEGDATLPVINPATGKVFFEVGRASKQQLEAAVAGARAAQPGWAATPREQRAAALNALADGIHAEAEEISRALTAEQGKPLAEAAGEVAMVEGIVRYFAGMDLPEEVLHDGDGFRVEAHYRPLGVVAGITPWNFPLAGGLAKGACALILGNTYIWKPAPTTPLAALMVARIAQRVFPAGVYNVITDANDMGPHISSHPGIDKVSFTGSTATGRKIMQSAAEYIKRVTLELGGNDAALVLDDADIDAIAPRIFQGAFLNAGQICVAIKRVYAHSSVYDRLCDALAKLAKEAVVGEGTEQGVQMGPMQNLQQYEKAKDYLRVAKADGKIIAGGEAHDREGYFIQPTIVRDIADESRLVTEEQFSPILPILSFDDVEDALARANDTTYGLGASVWTRDINRGRDLAHKIDSGTIWINQHLVTLPNVPFGGAKQSGLGTELGRDGLAEFAQLHVVNIATGS